MSFDSIYKVFSFIQSSLVDIFFSLVSQKNTQLIEKFINNRGLKNIKLSLIY